MYICRQETNGHLYGKGGGKVHYNRRQNKGWDGVSQIKKTWFVSHSGKRKGYVPVFGKRDMQFRKQKREWVVAPRLGSMHLGEMIHFCPFKNVGGYSESTLGRSCWTIAGRVVTTLIIKRDRHVRDCNESPKGHWSLTWVQWRLLLKFRFLSKSESKTAIFVKSVRTATIAIFQFRIRGCIRFVAVDSDLKKKSFGEKAPNWTI